MSLNLTVIRARSSKLTHLFKFLLAGLIYLSSAFAVIKPDSISFQFHNTPLKNALKQLIDDHGVSIVFPDDIVNTPISAQCKSCTQEEAVVAVLSTSNLVWKQTGNQFTVFNSVTPFRFAVSGRAMDKETGEPIPFANVFIPKLMIGDISQNDGSFSVLNISTRSCTLNISYIGYETEKVPILFPKGENVFHEIFISPKVLTTKTVSIMGTTREFMDRSNSPGQISFSPRHISTLPNLGEVDIFRSLQLLPGIQLGLGGTSGLNIRGGTPDQNLVLLDGMPLYQTDHLFGFVSGMNANAIKDVQVYKGGFPAKYGGRISSVIELTSRNGNSLKPHGSIYGNFMSQGVSGEIPILSRGSWIFNLRSSTTSTFQTELYESIQAYVTGDDNFNLIDESADTTKNQGATYSPQFSYLDFTNRFSFMLTPNHRLTLTNTTGLDSIRESRDFFGFSTILGYDSSYTQGSTEWKNSGTTLNVSSKWNHESDTQITLSNYDYSSSYDSKDSADVNNVRMMIGSVHEENTLQDRSIKFHHRYMGFENHKFESGIDETFYDISFSDHKIDGTTSNESSIEQNGFLHSFYIQDLWVPSPRWVIQPGLRVSYFSERVGFYTSPRLSVINKISPNITVESFIGKHYQFVHRLSGYNTTRGTQGMWILSSEDIPNISSLNTHFGLNYDFSDYTITGEFYYRSMEDLVQFKESSIPVTALIYSRSKEKSLIHQGSGKTNGIEIILRKRKGPITGWLSYQQNKTKYNFPELNNGKTFLSDHDKTQEFKSVFITNIGSWELTANWVFASGHVYTDSENVEVENLQVIISSDRNESRLPSIHHLDVSLSKTWRVSIAKIHTGLSIYNLYDRINISHKRYNPYKSELTMTDISMFGITPTIFLQISF
jgi:ferric enterobactin receptor